MKKSEIVTLFSVILCIGGFFVYFVTTGKIARAERETKKAQEELVEAQLREARVRQEFSDYQERQRAKEQEEAERLQDDYFWVTSKDSLPIYRRFAARFPDHSHIATIEKRIIDLEVKEIAAGDYGEMPKAQPLTYGGTIARIEIENKTGYTLTIRYSGSESMRVVIPVAGTEHITLPLGEYQVAASVSASHVTNYYGRESLSGGTYSSSFFIQTTRR